MYSEKLITAHARSWVGTKFHHQGRLKKTDTHSGGVDCLGLLIGVAKECELRSRSGELLHLLDETDYSHTPDTSRLYQKLCGALTLVSSGDMQAGDVVLMHVLNSPQHLGIVCNSVARESASAESHEILCSHKCGSQDDGMTLIHAYAQAGRVVEHPLDEYWRGTIKAVFRVL
jgi:cell wall-associated NlpC family hydrolase